MAIDKNFQHFSIKALNLERKKKVHMLKLMPNESWSTKILDISSQITLVCCNTYLEQNKCFSSLFLSYCLNKSVST